MWSVGFLLCELEQFLIKQNKIITMQVIRIDFWDVKIISTTIVYGDVYIYLKGENKKVTSKAIFISLSISQTLNKGLMYT